MISLNETRLSTVRSYDPISVDDYLSGELRSEIRHEFVDGHVYAMVGGTNAHNKIAINCVFTLMNQLQDKPCEAFSCDTKIKISKRNRFWFYYPDVSVTRQPNPQSDLFQEHPVVIIEVLSDSTRRNDELEKRNDYFTLPSLRHYLLLEQHTVTAIYYQRSRDNLSSDPADWSRTIFKNLDDVLSLDAIQCQLPLRMAYQGINF